MNILKDLKLKTIIYSIFISVILFCLVVKFFIFGHLLLKINMEFPKTHAVFLESKIYVDTFYGYNEENSETKKFNLLNKNNLDITFDLSDFIYIRKIRLDPINRNIGKIIINDISIIINDKKFLLDLKTLRETQNLIPLHQLKQFKIVNHKLIIKTGGYDPYLQIFKDFYFYLLQKFKIVLIIIFFILNLFVLLLFIYLPKTSLYLKLKQKVIYIFDFLDCFNKKALNFSLIFLLLSGVISKLSIIVYEIIILHTNINLLNFIAAFNKDLLIIFILFSFSLLFNFINKKSNKTLYFLNILLFLFVLTNFLIGLFYILNIFVYMSFGSYINQTHIQMLLRNGDNTEIWDTFFSLKGLFFIVVTSIVVISSIKISKIKIKIIYISVILLTFLSSIQFYLKFNTPYIKSPLLEILKSSKKLSGLNRNLIRNINIKNFNPLKENSTISKEDKKLFSIAKNFNIIFFIMESTRQKNIPLYGYKRNTMPFLTNIIAKHSLIFHNCTVNQPRSAKTLVSLTLGIYPNPTFDDVVQHYKSIKNPHESIFGILRRHNYITYFGTMQHSYGGKNWYYYFKKLDTDITIRDPRSYIEDKKYQNRDDERLSIDSFLKWSSHQKNKYIAMLWTKAAHYPYRSTIKKYQENDVIGMYDNCLVSLDQALKHLILGLKKQHKLRNTIIFIFGDHGEAVNQKHDFGHGSYFYEHSIKVPFLIYNPRFKRKSYYQRFQMKDIPATLFYLLGIDNKLHQSINIFSKSINDKIYMTNVYQDFKMGVVYKNRYKFVWRPEYHRYYLYDLVKDPQENKNFINSLSKNQIKHLREELLQYYKYQTTYIKHLIKSQSLP